MKLFIGALVLALSALAVSAEKSRFDNYRVYNIDVDTYDQLTVLRELSVTSDSVRSEIENLITKVIEFLFCDSTLSGMNQLESTPKSRFLCRHTSLLILAKS